MVFGDGLNDLELFDYAGIGIAMGVSHEELRKRADYIIKTVEEDGFSRAGGRCTYDYCIKQSR